MLTNLVSTFKVVPVREEFTFENLEKERADKLNKKLENLKKAKADK